MKRNYKYLCLKKTMFRDIDKNRTFRHNLRLATTLSFVAGIVNVCGVLAFGILTTNVTGHFAYFSEELSLKNYSIALVFLIFTLCFLFGAFFSNFLIELAYRRRFPYPHFYPILTEIILLSWVGISFWGEKTLNNNILFVCIMLTSMGLQNALVTRISKSVVRTTHLTGLFTDLGIDFSQLLFQNEKWKKSLLVKNIYLRVSIITFFFFGGLLGVVCFKHLHLKTLLLASAFLILALYFNFIRFQYYKFRRKYLINVKKRLNNKSKTFF